jgi:hypothetical protein
MVQVTSRRERREKDGKKRCAHSRVASTKPRVEPSEGQCPQKLDECY